MKKVIVVCGPTASGKTGFAHLLAKKNNGEIINADSMQLYRHLPIITASPAEELKSDLPYHLYNFLELSEEYSVVQYAKTAAKKIREISARGSLPILAGGSGLYINALIDGFSHIPDIMPEIRDKIRLLQKTISTEEFFLLLKKNDPAAAQTLNMQDSQRIARAYEVFLQTGKSILEYQQNNVRLLGEFAFEIILLAPERKFLYSACNSRLGEMFRNGAIEEVAHLSLQNINPELPPMKALGVKEIASFLRGDISKEEALQQAQARTRKYAKRQVTWFKNQIPEKMISSFSSYPEYQELLENIPGD